MKNLIISFALIYSAASWSSLTYLNFADAYINLDGKHGNLDLENIRLDYDDFQFSLSGPVNLSSTPQNNITTIEVPGSNIIKTQLGFLNSLLKNYQLSIQSGQVNIGRGSTFIKADSIQVFGDNPTLLEKPYIDCNGLSESFEVERILTLCSQRAELRLSKISFAKENYFLDRVLYEAKNQNKKIDDIKNIKLSVSNHSFSLELRAKFLINVTVKSKGNIWIDQENKILNLQINKANVGIFSVKKTLLNEIKKLESETLKLDDDILKIKYE